MLRGIISSLIFFSFSAQAGTIPEHRQEVLAITSKTGRFEARIQDLQIRKKQAREGEELEAVLTEIGNIHKELLGLRHDRSVLKEHLMKEHPDSNLLYDTNLNKNFDKSKKANQDPLDDRLDELLALMQTQYAQNLNRAAREGEVSPALKAKIKAKDVDVEDAKPEPAKPLSAAESREKYMRDQLQTEMKIQGDPQAVARKKAKLAAKEAERKAAEKEAAEHAKAEEKSGGHGEKPAAHGEKAAEKPKESGHH